LEHAAATRADAFTLVHCERLSEGRSSRSVYRELPLDALSIDGGWQYMIRSRALHPALPAPEPRDGVGWPREFALNGLIGLHHPEPAGASESRSSSIGIVNRIVREQDGTLHEHDAADALFAAVRRALTTAGARAV
jgi:hypothetical protein